MDLYSNNGDATRTAPKRRKMSDNSKRGIVCCFCGEAWGYEGETPSEELIKNAYEHERTCLSNPYIIQIKSLEEENTKLKLQIRTLNESIASKNRTINKLQYDSWDDVTYGRDR